MATRKYNEFLDADNSDEDGSQGYDSEVEDLKKGTRKAPSKRQKVAKDDDDDDDEDDDDNDDLARSDGEGGSQDDVKNGLEESEVEAKSHRLPKSADVPGLPKPLSKKSLLANEKAAKRAGVIYISRVPPFMKPQKLRSLLEPYGEINRIFLTPEDPASHTRRVKGGGNKKRSFTDGWVEFFKKTEAKEACELLNAQIIGGKKGSYYHDDLWNLKYLKGFKWHHLTDQMAAEVAERASRMRAEISKTTKENSEFVLNVERAKMLEGMEAKKAAKSRQDEDDKPAKRSTDATSQKRNKGERPRHFKQTEVAPKRKSEQPEQVRRVLSKIF